MIRKQNYFGQIILAADLAVVMACYWAAYWTRLWMWRSGYPVLPIGRASVNSWIIIVSFAAWMIAARRFRLYNPLTYRSVARVLVASFKAQMVTAVLELGVIFVLRGFSGISRLLLALFVLFSLLGSAVQKLIVVFVVRYHSRLQRPATVWRVLVVGKRDDAESYLNLVREHPEWNLRIVGIVPATPNDIAEKRVGGDLYSTTRQ